MTHDLPRNDADNGGTTNPDFVDGLDAADLLVDRYPAGMPVDDVARIVTAVAVRPAAAMTASRSGLRLEIKRSLRCQRRSKIRVLPKLIAGSNAAR
jgi:hypothetical protein